MLLEIIDYIEECNVKSDSMEQIDLLFNKLCDKYCSDDDNNINTIKFILLDMFSYDPMKRNENIKKICRNRDEQNKFREELILRDKNCLITGDNYEICEACHIVPYSKTKSFDISNGLLLNRCFHKMFDKHLWSIDDNNCVVFSPKILESEYFHHYICYSGKKINIDNNCKSYIKMHWEIFVEFNKC